MRLCAAVLAAGRRRRPRDGRQHDPHAAVDLWESDPPPPRRSTAPSPRGTPRTWSAWRFGIVSLLRTENEFNEDIGAWNTSSVTSMNRMFWLSQKFDKPIGVFAASDSSAPPGAEPAQAPGTSARSRTLSACSATRRCSTKTSVFCGVLFVFGLGYENAIAAIGLSSPIRYRRNSPSTRTLARDQHAIAATVRAEKIPTSTPSPRSRPRAGDWRVDNAETIDRMFYGASAFDQDLGWCTLATVDRAFHTVPVERLCFAVSFVSLPLFVLCRGDFAPAPVARSLRPSRSERDPQTPSARPHGVAYARRRRPARRPCRGPGALGACEPEKTPAPTPDPEGRVCNGGPYDGRRCQNHGFCQQPDPTQPDVDACDDCKCITRKDSDGAGRFCWWLFCCFCLGGFGGFGVLRLRTPSFAIDDATRPIELHAHKSEWHIITY